MPGAVRGWEDLLARHGRMTLADVLPAAIGYARDGFPVSPLFGASWGLPAVVDLLRQCPYAGDYLPGGRAPQVGEIVRLPDLARTLQAVADGGADAFYHGANRRGHRRDGAGIRRRDDARRPARSPLDVARSDPDANIAA